jgi:A/G-specific adenine glycosylase
VEPAFIELTEHYSNIIEITTNFEEVCKIMYSLGRFCRLNYFKQGLDTLVKNFNGEIPYHTEMLLLIPGIGPYIAAAIRIFGFGLKDTIIDTNVVRVLGRIYGIEITPETRRNKAFINLAKHHVPDNNFVEYSYGILDFASAICRSRIPECRSCGLGKYCNYYKNKLK